MRFLYCLFPLSGHDGYSVVALDLLENLAGQGHRVDCAVLVEGRQEGLEEANEPLRRLSREIFFYDHPHVRGGPERLLARIQSRLLPRRPGGRQFCPPGFYRTLRRRFDLRRYDAAVAATAKFSRLAELVSCPAIVDLHELFTHKVKLLGRHGIRCLSPYLGLAEEVDAIRRFDLVWCPSRFSRRVLERIIPGKVFIDRHITYRTLTPVGYSPPPPSAGGPGRILFVGSTAPENIPGLATFLREILPPIRRAIPSVECHVVGFRKEDLPGGADVRNLVPHGRLKGRGEVLDLFSRTDVVVIPRFLGGLTVKGVEALCLGKAAVGHEAAFSGCYAVESWKQAVIARTSDEFSGAVVRLLRDPVLREEIGRNAWEFSRRQFSPESAYGGLFQGLEEFRRRSAAGQGAAS